MKPIEKNEHPLTPWIGACPTCRKSLGQLNGITNDIYCPDCSTSFKLLENNILDFLPPERGAFYSRFLDDYTRIRLEEGRGSNDPDHYLRLPDVAKNNPLAWQWQIRAKTYGAFICRLIQPSKNRMKIADLGAGCGWLSYRLSMLGHSPCAVDINIDAGDGLGAARHYHPNWPVIRAEFDRLPLADAQADMVIFNASFHYSTDYPNTLREAVRVSKPDAKIVILDSPVYRKRESGIQMVRERKARFAEKFGTPSDALPSIEYLTWDMLTEFEFSLGLCFQNLRVWYGPGWALRPVKAFLKRKRQPSTFAILVGRKTEK